MDCCWVPDCALCHPLLTSCPLPTHSTQLIGAMGTAIISFHNAIRDYDTFSTMAHNLPPEVKADMKMDPEKYSFSIPAMLFAAGNRMDKATGGMKAVLRSAAEHEYDVRTNGYKLLVCNLIGTTRLMVSEWCWILNELYVWLCLIVFVGCVRCGVCQKLVHRGYLFITIYEAIHNHLHKLSTKKEIDQVKEALKGVAVTIDRHTTPAGY
jgi:hypothetical protein